MEHTQVGKYKILAEIGEGAMGQVFKAHDPILGRDVALKTISAKVGADDEMRKRFHREAQAAAQLNHPNIITVHDFGEEAGRIYIAMELLDGVDLKDFMASGALKSLGARLEVMDQILEALAFAHTKGVVHRDLKPANIHVLRSAQIKLMDFGLARIGSTSDTTKAGTVLGTPNYMSPEQVMGGRADFRSDVFSAGAVFYELLSGRKPFDADSVHAVLFQVVHKEPVSLRKCAPETPAVLVALVEKALAKDPANRFKDAGELKAALGRARASLGGVRAPAAPAGGIRAPGPAESSAAAAATGEHDPEATMHVPGALRVEASEPPAPQPPPPATRPAPSAPRPSTPPASRSGSARSRPPEVPQAHDHSRWRRLVPLVLVFGLVAGIGGSYLLMGTLVPSPGAPAAGGSAPDLGALTRTLAATQAQLAQRVLEDKDYKGAMAQAEQALKLDPRNAAARGVLQKARETLAALDAAAAEAAAALDAGETDRGSEALSRILALDPQHPVVTELSARLNGVFRAKAEEARRLAGAARGDAEKAKAESVEPFGRAAQRAKEAEASFARNEFAAATQSFLEARDAFDRARRAATTRTASATPPPTPEARREEPPRPAADTNAATAPEPAPASVPARALVAGRSTVQSARAGGAVAGFDSEDVSVRKTPDFVGRIEFAANPTAVKAGDSYQVKVHLVNDGHKEIEVRGVKLTIATNGVASTRDLAPAVTKLAPRQQTTLAELGGVWEEHVTSWSVEVVVTSNKGDSCRNTLGLK
jgi:serine/threonine-protein kinase